jgi:O6-methylguanine-DNA--protein-cysteine methyltransferase
MFSFLTSAQRAVFRERDSPTKNRRLKGVGRYPTPFKRRYRTGAKIRQPYDPKQIPNPLAVLTSVPFGSTVLYSAIASVIGTLTT